jgi:hypothetical protein
VAVFGIGLSTNISLVGFLVACTKIFLTPIYLFEWEAF